MNKFVKLECACDIGYDKGALKKTIENNIFTIFGNITQNSSIVIRYHGVLTDNHEKQFNIYYYFDTPDNTKTYIALKKCAKCSGECYCANIDLDCHSKLYFGFTDENNNIDNNVKKDFELSISPDPISNIMQRYGFEENPNLPICEDKTECVNKFKKILIGIQNIFKKLLIQNPT